MSKLLPSFSRSAITLAAVTALAAGGIAAARNAEAISAMFAPPTPVIVTIDLQKVFSGLEERTARQNELEAMGKGMQEELDKLLAAGKDENSKMEMLPEGVDRLAAAEKLTEMQLNIRVKKELFEAKLDQRRSNTFRLLYQKITDASRRLAVQSKYTLVLTSDETVEIPGNLNTADTQKAISTKRFLFVDPAHDVSTELVTMMNNEYRSAGTRGPGMTPAPNNAPAPAAVPATPAK